MSTAPFPAPLTAPLTTPTTRPESPLRNVIDNSTLTCPGAPPRGRRVPGQTQEEHIFSTPPRNLSEEFSWAMEIDQNGLDDEVNFWAADATIGLMDQTADSDITSSYWMDTSGPLIDGEEGEGEGERNAAG